MTPKYSHSSYVLITEARIFFHLDICVLCKGVGLRIFPEVLFCFALFKKKNKEALHLCLFSIPALTNYQEVCVLT